MNAEAFLTVMLMDISSFDDEEHQNGTSLGLAWSVSVEEYDGICRHLTDALAQVIEETAGNKRICLTSKVQEILLDAIRIVRIGLEISNAKRTGLALSFNPDHSPVASILSRGGNFSDEVIAFFWPPPRSLGAVEGLNIFRRRMEYDLKSVLAGSDKTDVLFDNILSREFVAATPGKYVRFHPGHFYWGTGAVTREVQEMVGQLLAAMIPVFPAPLKADKLIHSRVIEGLRPFFTWHLTQAWSDLAGLRGYLSGKRLGARLLGGTPNYRGRLISALYREKGREVIRFSHGGERGLFADYQWGLTELSHCDTYYLHGLGEAKLLEQRFAGGEAPIEGNNPPAFKSLGSRKHENLLRKARKRGGNRKNEEEKTLVYVSNAYLGERVAHFPCFKLPDPVYFEWQRWLLRTLKEMGYKIQLKPHPKGVINQEKILGPYVDEVISGLYDPDEMAGKCLLFDFPGSAFMDALATEARVMFFDLGNRPLDKGGAQILDQRVTRVKVTAEPILRLRVDREVLKDSIEKTQEMDALPLAVDFSNNYFNPLNI